MGFKDLNFGGGKLQYLFSAKQSIFQTRKKCCGQAKAPAQQVDAKPEKLWQKL